MSAEILPASTDADLEAPVWDLDRCRHFLQWIFLTDCGRCRRAGFPRLVVLPALLTPEQHAQAKEAYLAATNHASVTAILR